jgi:hypothetical protein
MTNFDDFDLEIQPEELFEGINLNEFLNEMERDKWREEEMQWEYMSGAFPDED